MSFRDAVDIDHVGYCKLNDTIMGINYEVKVVLTDYKRQIRYTLKEKLTFGFDEMSNRMVKKMFADKSKFRQDCDCLLVFYM